MTETACVWAFPLILELSYVPFTVLWLLTWILEDSLAEQASQAMDIQECQQAMKWFFMTFCYTQRAEPSPIIIREAFTSNCGTDVETHSQTWCGERESLKHTATTGSLILVPALEDLFLLLVWCLVQPPCNGFLFILLYFILSCLVVIS